MSFCIVWYFQCIDFYFAFLNCCMCWFANFFVKLWFYTFFCWPVLLLISRAVNILAEMRSTLGLNDCKLLCINSSTQADGSDADNSWLPYVSALNYLWLNYINVYVVQQVCNLLIIFSWLTAESSWLTQSWRSLFP